MSNGGKNGLSNLHDRPCREILKERIHEETKLADVGRSSPQPGCGIQLHVYSFSVGDNA